LNCLIDVLLADTCLIYARLQFHIAYLSVIGTHLRFLKR